MSKTNPHGLYINDMIVSLLMFYNLVYHLDVLQHPSFFTPAK